MKFKCLYLGDIKMYRDDIWICLNQCGYMWMFLGAIIAAASGPPPVVFPPFVPLPAKAPGFPSLSSSSSHVDHKFAQM